MSIELIKSPVEVNEELHRYTLGDKRLMGITGLIHSVLELGVYTDANDFVRNIAIPRASQYGSSVHKAIELYDDLGIKETTYPNSFGDEDWDVSRELESYIRHRQGFRPLANEYTVSDNFQYASQIDNVWIRESTGGIWLADTKTNNLNYYPLDGYGLPNYFANHADGLKEYLSWQLSVYAVLFERQNPGLKVEGLCANWLRKDEAAFWIIERKPDEAVLELLKAVWYESFDGSIVYEHPDRKLLHPQLGQRPQALPKPEKVILPEDVVTYMAGLLRTVKESESKLEEAKTALRAAMEQHGVRKFDFGAFTATLGADTQSTMFNSTKFKKDNPQLFEKYSTKTTRKGSLTLKLKDND